jgi:hypothetical protein
MRWARFVVGALIFVPARAQAVRFTLGLATDFTPVVIESIRPPDAGTPIRLGLLPVIEVEPAPWISFGAYFPFTVLRTGEGSDATTGAESVFGFTMSLRSVHLDRGPEPDEKGREWMLYGTARGGFATVQGRAGPFLGAGAGYALTWLDTGRGFFVELNGGHSHVSLPQGTDDRWLFGLTLGVVFRLGGETWWLNEAVPPAP